MRIWMRLLAGSGLGIIVGMLVPVAGGDTVRLFEQLSDIVLRIGRYAITPLMFFGLIVGIDELRSDGSVFKVVGRFIVWTVAASVIAVVLGALAVLLLEPQRIPPLLQTATVSAPPDIFELLRNTIPANMFRLFVMGDDLLVPILVAAVVIGVALGFDREVTHPVSLVVDSAGRLFYHINRFVVQLLGIGLVAPVALLVVQLRNAQDLTLFAQMILVVGVAVAVVGLIMIPILLRLLAPDRSAVGWLRQMLGPMVTALGTGNMYATLSVMVHEGREELSVPRRVGSFVFPFGAAFSRGGTALVSTIGFLLVLRSYTALEIQPLQIVVLMAAALGYSFFLAGVPTAGVATMLSYLALEYGQGLDESFLILVPAMPLLERLAALLNTLVVGFIGTVTSSRTGYRSGRAEIHV